ncbi:BCCT family transporter [Mesobacillus maritimus]|uniref:BCCT family transporter n=1 Tax=Mesobacillus maritimus TaxID=1643336 RepID=UPI0020422875|nr:BCCT family transporter [Mesobacillus maritimus]MCM3588183.1 BCCT family transporter [Mesobacillus maritimus]MCM3668883.1 BCCT family transporter [Mesobacillus maritimus]
MDRNSWKNTVFIVSAIIISLLVILGAVVPKGFGRVAGSLFEFTTVNFGWFYLLAVFVLIIFLVGLAISKYGAIRLGGEKERPEFSFFTWIGMLFSAGFGAGLVFWGVAEPMSHFFLPPTEGVDGQTVDAARLAMGYSFFHWGVSQWSVFAIVGLVIGFLQFRKERDGLVSTALEPITGEKTGVKNTIDSLAVIATVMGIATSIGLGVLQMNGGLGVVFGIGNSVWIQMILIAIIFVAYMLSSSTGLEKGIKYLSNLNLGLAIVLLLFVFIMGPTVFILESFTLGLGDYLTNFIQYSLRLQPYRGGTWVRDWTIFYWAWAIAWSPYVGAFVARVSRGRTIREYIMGVMVIPPLIACVWIATFGGTGLWNDLNNGTSIAEAVNADLTTALFQTYEYLPFDTILSVLSILLIFTFLVTSADSATYILASMTMFGSLNPPQMVKVVWGVLMSAIAAVLLYAGGLEALQTASLIAALPFTLILLLLMFAIAKLLAKEPLPIRKADLRRFRRLEEAANKPDKKMKKKK